MPAPSRNAFESVLMRWMNLQPIIHNEVSQKEKNVILTHIYGTNEDGTAAAKSLQSCPTLCDPIDRSPPGSAVPSPGKNTGVGCHCLLWKMVLMNLFAGQQWRNRHTGHTCGHSSGRRGWDESRVVLKHTHYHM